MTADTQQQYVVEIVENETENVIWRSKPTTERRAEKIEFGAGINLDWENFHTRIEKVEDES